MLRIKLSFKWYQSRGNLIKILFLVPLAKLTLLWSHQRGVEILDITSKLNLLTVSQNKVWAEFDTFCHNFSLRDSTNTGTAARFFSNY